MSHPDEDPVNITDSNGYVVAWSPRGHLTEDAAYAWLDGALDASDATAVAAHVATCATCAAIVADARGYMAATSRIVLLADLTARSANIANVRDAAVSAGAAFETSSTAATRSPGVRAMPRLDLAPVHRWYARPVVRAAASMALVVGASAYMLSRVEIRLPASGTVRVSDKVRVKDKDRLPDSVPLVTRAVPEAKTKATTPSVRAPAVSRVKEAAHSAVTAGQATVPNTFVMPSSVPSMLAPWITVVGSVTTPGGRAVEGAQVTVYGSRQGVVTDADGQFVLRNVPSHARLQVRRIGFTGHVLSLPDSLRDTARVTIDLEPSVNQLSAVTVKADQAPLVDRRDGGCLRATSESLGANAPIFRVITGHVDAPGRYVLSVVGWPSDAEASNIDVVLGDDGTMRGKASRGEVQLTIALTRDGARWSGTVDERRGTFTRSERLTFDVETSAARCSR